MVVSRGHLNPGSPGVALSRFPVGLDPLVRWAWVVRWELAPGRTVAQRVLQYPSFNLVAGPQGADLHGPRTVVDVRELAGRSWVVGLLLRPGATPALTGTPPAALAGTAEPMPGAPIAELTAAVHAPGGPDRAVAAVVRYWLEPVAGRVTEAGRLVNRACALAEDRPDIVRVDQLAAEVQVAPRTLERLVRAHAVVADRLPAVAGRGDRAA
ncbi:DUF6597 domain-containing transcriptional factor [Pseudonocardia sp. HH130630-07]|uniref:DUF6597 domain-containing transcriptional factor n=1 Tax=Pseudonocardia sp. HH130630-07 TaxID=1690815 RepID=UPI000814DB2E|nr:DUF6597 domain-containing transcriptional factor [Pseudonocardia sp. HH130630-07]ANY08210.1 hypothetical protein AFB00_20185 [Pseudonocardia sp. HH130630-07]